MLNITSKTALVVVDFQGGDLPNDSEYGGVTLPKAQAMVAAARNRGVPVVWIQEVHKPHLQDIGRELDGSESAHCIEGDPGTEIATGLEPLASEFHVKKRRYSAFFGTSLDIILKSYGVDSLVLIGGFTDICVLYTAVDAHQRDFRLAIASDVLLGSSGQAHDDAILMMANLQPGSIVSSQEVLGWFDKELVQN